MRLGELCPCQEPVRCQCPAVGRSRIRERSQYLRCGLADVAEAFGQHLGIAVPKLNVVGCRRTSFETNGLTDDERVRRWRDGVLRGGAKES